MLKQAIAVFFLLFLVSGASAISIQILSPETGSSVVSGEPFKIRFEAFFSSSFHSASMWCNGDESPRYLLQESGFFAANTEIETPNYDTSNIYGQCTIIVYANCDPNLFPDCNPNTQEGYQETSRVTFENAADHQDNKAALVVRHFSSPFLLPGALLGVTVDIFPRRDFTGIVVRENPPEGFELDTQMFGGNIVNMGDYTFDQANRQLKVLMRGTPAIRATGFMYFLRIPANLPPRTTATFNGTWAVLNEEGEIKGDQNISVPLIPGNFFMPECPMTDQQLLQFVDQWARMTLGQNEMDNDMRIMQVLEVWKRCNAGPPM